MIFGDLGFGLNEVQFPKELQAVRCPVLRHGNDASMKCSSRRNCDAAKPINFIINTVPQ